MFQMDIGVHSLSIHVKKEDFLSVYKQQPHSPIYTHKLALLFDCFAYANGLCRILRHISLCVKRLSVYSVLSVECFALRM